MACNVNENLDSALESIELENQLARISKTILVMSGKGGVGKSTTAANLAVMMSLSGYTVGLLDIDFHGPSIPKLLGMENKKADMKGEKLIPLVMGDTLKVMSLGLLLQNQDDAVIWRGPMKMGAIQQLLRDVDWGDLDYLIVDCPPGTGDEPLSIVQILKKPTGALIVTQPQDLSVADVKRSVKFCEKLEIPVLGVIENMSGFICPHCNEHIDIFKSGGGKNMAESFKIPFLGKIPLDPEIVTASDEGKPFVYFGKKETADCFQKIIDNMLEVVEMNNKDEQKSENNTTDSEKSVTKFAIPLANNELCMHFGHCEQFAIIDYDENEKKIVNSDLQTPPPHEPGVLPKWLGELGVNTILAGGMGSRAQQLFASNGISVVTGAPVGKAEDLVKAYVGGNMETGINTCDH